MEHLRDPILLTHLFATSAMTGLIWFVQIVHYPLMSFAARADNDSTHYPAFQAQHMRRTTFVVLPLMLTELACAIAIPLLDLAPKALAIPALTLLVLIWIATFTLQVPAHQTLEKAFNPKAHRSLVRTNWTRTALWTSRSVLAALMLTAS